MAERLSIYYDVDIETDPTYTTAARTVTSTSKDIGEVLSVLCFPPYQWMPTRQATTAAVTDDCQIGILPNNFLNKSTIPLTNQTNNET